MIVLAAQVSACFPYLENVRPDIRGRVVDESGEPIANVTVRACSASKWVGTNTCKIEETAVSDRSGFFAFAAETRVDWCCLGEAPFYRTALSLCTEDGRHAMSLVEGGPAELTLRAGAHDDETCEQVPTFRPAPAR